MASRIFFPGTHLEPKGIDELVKPHPVGLRRPTAAGYWFSILRRQQGFPAIRKSSLGIAEEAATIASAPHDCVASAQRKT